MTTTADILSALHARKPAGQRHGHYRAALGTLSELMTPADIAAARDAYQACERVRGERAGRRVSRYAIMLKSPADRLNTSITLGERASQRLGERHSANPIADKLGVQAVESTLMFVERATGRVAGLVAYAPGRREDYTWEGCYKLAEHNGRSHSVGSCFSTCGRPLVGGRRADFQRRFIGGAKLAAMQVIQIGCGGLEIENA